MSNESTTAPQHGRPHGPEPPRSRDADVPPGSDEAAEPSTPEADPADGEEAARELSRDLVFDALSNSRRRHALQYLDQRGEGVTLSDLAEHVAARENDTTPEDLTSQQRKRVYVGLYQCHLPRLEEMGLIEFDRSRGDVQLDGAASRLETYLYPDDADDRPWYHHYAGFLAVSALVLTSGVAAGALEIAAAAALFAGKGVGVAGLAAVLVYGRD